MVNNEVLKEKKKELDEMKNDLILIDELVNSSWWEVYKKIWTTYRKHLVKTILSTTGNSEKNYTQDDLHKSNLRMINDIIDLNETQYEKIKERVAVLETEYETLLKQASEEQLSDIERIDIGTADDLYAD